MFYLPLGWLSRLPHDVVVANTRQFYGKVILVSVSTNSMLPPDGPAPPRWRRWSEPLPGPMPCLSWRPLPRVRRLGTHLLTRFVCSDCWRHWLGNRVIGLARDRELACGENLIIWKSFKCSKKSIWKYMVTPLWNNNALASQSQGRRMWERWRSIPPPIFSKSVKDGLLFWSLLEYW